MKKFLSMFFMLSVLPTVGLAVDATSTHDPYNRLDKFDKQAKDYQDTHSKTSYYTQQYKDWCKSLHRFTTNYNLLDKYTATNGNTYTLREEDECDSIYDNITSGKAATLFLSQVSWANWQIKEKQRYIVENNCNINHGKSFYKEFGWDGGRTTYKEPTIECAATSEDNRCLLIQPLQNLSSGKKEKYYSCNRPELEFTKRDNSSWSIYVKADINTCGVMAEFDTTAGILDDRIKLTLKDFDEDCQLKKDSERGEILYDLSENKYDPAIEEAKIQEIVSRWQ